MMNHPHIDIDSIKKIREGCQQGGDDFLPIAEFWRGDHLVFVSFGTTTDLGATLAATSMAVPCTDASHVTLVFEARASRSPINPATGEPWNPAELDHMLEAHPDSPAAAAVQRMMVLVVGTKDEVEVTGLTFGVDGDEVIWKEELDLGSSYDEIEAQHVDALREAFGNRDVHEMLLSWGPAFGVSGDDAQLHLDAIGMKYLIATGQHEISVGGYPDGDVRNDKIVAFLEGQPTPAQISQMIGMKRGSLQGGWN